MATLQNNVAVEEPLVSVIVPVYNSHAYLAECIESLLAQTLQSTEFVFVDDGSTDDSLDIIKAYQKKDSRIKLLLQEHGGAGRARNYGISHAKGKYITLLDSDDLFLPKALEVAYSHAEQYDSDITLYAVSEFSSDKEKNYRINSILNYDFLPDFEPFSHSSWPKYIFQTSGGQSAGRLIRKAFIEKNHIEFPDLPRTEDAPFAMWSLAAAERISYIKETLYLYRKIDGSGSLEDAKDRYPTSFYDAMVLIWDNLDSLGLRDSLRQSMINYILCGSYYNLRTMKTLEGFAAAYDCIKNKLIPDLGISFDDRDYYYYEGIYNYYKVLMESHDYMDFLLRMQEEFSVLQRRIIRDRETNKGLRNEIKDIRSSASYKIGRMITWLPRKIRRLFKKK